MKLLQSAILILLLTATGWSQQDQDTPDDAGAANADQAPAVPGRGSVRQWEASGYQAFVGLMGMYDSGLGSTTTAASSARYGMMGNFGISMHQVRPHTLVELAYHGDGRYYTESGTGTDNNHGYGAMNGFDNGLTLSVDHTFSPKISVLFTSNFEQRSHGSLVPAAGGNWNVSNYLLPSMMDLLGVDLLNGQTLASSNRVQMVYTPTLRNSFSVGGSGFVTWRESHWLFGAQGYGASADWAHRLSARTTFSTRYDVMQINYRMANGSSRIQTAALSLSTMLGPRTEFSISGGASQVDSHNVQVITLDPVLADVLGKTQIENRFDGRVYAPNAGVQIGHRMLRSSIGAGYQMMVMPGNGMFSTSRRQMANANYSYEATRKLSFGMDAAFNQLNGLRENARYATVWSGGGGFTYKVIGNLSFQTRADYRNWKIAESGFSKNYVVASAGLAWSTGDRPLSIF